MVLYAKSGLGKSSLINAGLIPKVEAGQNFACFSIRFGAYKADTFEDSPLTRTKQNIGTSGSFLEKIIDEKEYSLWYRLKNYQLNNPDQGILLIFDQFEELFTYPEAMVEAFGQELSEALYTNIPQRIRDRRKSMALDLPPEQLQALDQPIKLRVLMAIRSDRMSLLKR